MAEHSPITAARFWSKVRIPDVPRHENLCWLWTGSTAKGYGQVKIDKTVYRCHRVAYELFNGEVPEGMGILHACDNPLCVNPRHLRPGTHQENMTDKKVRDRVYRGGPVSPTLTV
jgi:hypothetical protein